MDRGSWQATVHGLPQSLDMTDLLSRAQYAALVLTVYALDPHWTSPFLRPAKLAHSYLFLPESKSCQPSHFHYLVYALSFQIQTCLIFSLSFYLVLYSPTLARYKFNFLLNFLKYFFVCVNF